MLNIANADSHNARLKLLDPERMLPRLEQHVPLAIVFAYCIAERRLAADDTHFIVRTRTVSGVERV